MPVDALAFIVHQDKAYTTGKRVCKQLQETIHRSVIDNYKHVFYTKAMYYRHFLIKLAHVGSCLKLLFRLQLERELLREKRKLHYLQHCLYNHGLIYLKKAATDCENMYAPTHYHDTYTPISCYR